MDKYTVHDLSEWDGYPSFSVVGMGPVYYTSSREIAETVAQRINSGDWVVCRECMRAHQFISGEPCPYCKAEDGSNA